MCYGQTHYSRKSKDRSSKVQHHIDLAESYDTGTLNKWIVKKYAYTNSIRKIIEKATSERLTIKEEPLRREYVASVINGKANDELHKILRSGYRLKIKPNKR